MRIPALLAAALAASLCAASRAADAPPTTVDCSGLAESESTDTATTTVFHDQVVAIGNGIRLDCDYLKVVASRLGDKTATLGKYGRFQYLLATGHVRIVQGDRTATCGRAEIFPEEDRIVLTEHPVVRDSGQHSEVTGPRMVLYRGQRRVVVEGTPDQQTHITLPSIKNLGFDADAKAPAQPEPPASK